MSMVKVNFIDIRNRKFNVFSIEAFAWVTVLIVILDRILGKRALFADGSCMFFRYFYEHGINNPIPGRYLGGLLLSVPLAIAQISGVKDLDVQFFLWNAGFAFPFLVCLGMIYFLQADYRMQGFFIIGMAATLFYLPNSYFAVGEYNMVYPVLALLVPALRQQYLMGDAKSAILSGSCLYILALSYEPAAIFAVMVAMGIFGVSIWQALNGAHTPKPELTKITADSARAIIWPSFLLLTIVLFSAISIASTPKWAKENARNALTVYLTETPRGAVADTWLYLTIIVSFLLVWKMNSSVQQTQNAPASRHKNIYTYSSWALISFVTMAALLTNHLPVHSYFSKTIFVPIFLLLCANLMICSRDQFARLEALLAPAFCFILLGVTIWLVREGFQFNTFLGRLERDLNALPAQSLVEADRLPIFNSRLGKAYTWSWAQVCLARYISPSGKSSTYGQFDREYFLYFQMAVDETLGKR